MRDFDQELREPRLRADRSFKIGGEVFTYRASVAPEVIAEWGDSDLEGAADKGVIQLVDNVVLQFLEPGQEETWARVRDREAEFPISTSDLVELIKWLIGVQTNRPTERPSDSSPTDGSGGNSSTVVSPLRAVEASTS